MDCNVEKSRADGLLRKRPPMTTGPSNKPMGNDNNKMTSTKL